MAPFIFIVPGLYEGQRAFEPLAAALADLGYHRITLGRLASTGTASKPGEKTVTMDDDSAFLARQLLEAVETAGVEYVIVVLHSAGGFLGCGAMQGLSVAARKSADKPGGILKNIYIAAALLPEGFKHMPLPWMENNASVPVPSHSPGIRNIFTSPRTGTQTVMDVKLNMFNDCDDAEAERWIAEMQHQPAEGWDGVVQYCGWREIPGTYLLAENDNMLPVAKQEYFSSLAGANVVRIRAGHMAQLSRTADVAKYISDVVQGKIEVYLAGSI
ncbi:hypothetical protein QQS21_003808 [Conoideocrella luteorostrata]|uniref:AB hydrolase-1 domain-containing protein n=1 Tax=Conoideocrella luteorostrata TaxID=1105319 RepID=A0AAJ0G093_9HYPO|nr:hypothetical protein QQS21_003808 [Conoideocrella luteorostrata]